MKKPYVDIYHNLITCPKCKAPLMRESEMIESVYGEEEEVTITCLNCDYTRTFTDEGMYDTNAFDDYWQ